MSPTTKPAKGFTLIELVIVTVVLGIMGAALVPLMISSLGAYKEVRDDIVVLDKQRYAIERLAREIREVSFDQASSSFVFASGAAGMGDHQMAFTRQFIFSASGVAASATAVVNIVTAGSTVTLGYDGTAKVLTDQLASPTGLTFSYFNQSGVAISPSVSAVRAVGIDLTLTRNNGQDYTQTTRVELKNHIK